MAQLKALTKELERVKRVLERDGFTATISVEDNGKQGHSLAILEASREGITKDFSFLTSGVKTIKTRHYSGDRFSGMSPAFRTDFQKYFGYRIRFQYDR
jgi:hypothetical protein